MISKQIEKFREVDSPDNMDRISSDLYDIKNSITESMELLLDKDRSIGEAADRANKLRETSQKYREEAAKTRLSLQLRQYLLFIVIGVVILLVIGYKFLL